MLGIERGIMKKIFVLMNLMILSLLVSSCFKIPKVLEVTFMVNGQTYETIEVLEGTTLVLPEDPTIDKYVFEGWYYDALFTDPFDKDTDYEVTYAFTLIAKMTLIEEEDPVILPPIGDYTGERQSSNGYYYVSPITPDSYYKDAIDLVGEALKLSLRTRLNTGVSLQRYSDAKQILAISDRVTVEDKDYSYAIYNGALVNNVWDSKSWHREHVWPNSRLGMARVGESNRNQASDLHNLRAIVPSVNSSRSNRYFDYKENGFGTVGSDAYYPGDDHRGDVARILFYMVVMYDFLSLENENIPDIPYEMAGAVMGKLDLLLEWHRLDPVDEFEENRNEVIYQYQKNRNPFIDYPEFVHLIFEGFTIEHLTAPGIDTSLSLDDQMRFTNRQLNSWNLA